MFLHKVVVQGFDTIQGIPLILACKIVAKDFQKYVYLCSGYVFLSPNFVHFFAHADLR
ncbi:hypothetical protein P303_02820 [Xylella fastidiosa MUL0034]|nr:hypothetical protein P303_02820 [Xylella fastidiosa MUL0034]